MSNHTFQTSVNTIRDVEHDVTINFDYSPSEEQWFDPFNGEGSPGYDASVELLEVKTVLQNKKTLDFILSQDQIPETEWDLLEMRAMEYVDGLESDEPYE